MSKMKVIQENDRRLLLIERFYMFEVFALIR